MELSYSLTAEDYREGFKVFRSRSARARWIYRVANVMAFLCFLVALLLTFFGPDRTFDKLYPIWFICIFWGYYLWLCPMMVARKMIRSNPTARAVHNVEVTDEGSHYQSELSGGHTGWKTYVGWHENNRVFALFPSSVTFVPVPKRAMTPEQQNEFREMLRKHVKA